MSEEFSVYDKDDKLDIIVGSYGELEYYMRKMWTGHKITIIAKEDRYTGEKIE